MGRADYWKAGDFNAICDNCGQKYKGSQLKLQWNGFRTCSTCFDIRQPQDFVRGMVDDQTPPFTRPDATPTFVEGAQELEPVPSGVN